MNLLDLNPSNDVKTPELPAEVPPKSVSTKIPPKAIYYSKSGNCFFDTHVFDYDLPQDAVKITKKQHQALMDAQSQGKVIQADPDGNPVAVARPVDKAAVLAAQARTILAANDRTAIRMLREGKPWPEAWRAYDDALRAAVRGEIDVMPVEPALKPWEA